MKKRHICRQSKEGVAIDLDWIISLGIFLIYLGVFFVVIRQLPTQQSPASALLGNVIDGIKSSTRWTVQELPLVIASNISGPEPMMVRFRYAWQNLSFKDSAYFEKKGGRLIFVKELSAGRNLLELVSSGENYTLPVPVLELEATSSGASVNSQRFLSEFQSSMLSRVNHYGKERLGSLNLSISGVSLRPETATPEANITALSAMYALEFPAFNHSSFVVAGYPRIISYVNSAAKEPHNLSVAATLMNYTSFYISDAAYGAINYTTRGCVQAKGDYIDFYDGLSGATFISPPGSNISFCAGDATVRLRIDIPIENETRYDIIFHAGDYSSTLKYISPYTVAFGMAENLSGVSKGLFQMLNETDYEALKKRWGYPSSREFSFGLFNETGTQEFNYTPKSPGITNVFAKEADVFVLDKYAAESKYELRVRGW